MYVTEKGAVTAKSSWPLAPRDLAWSKSDADKRIRSFLKIDAPNATYDQCCLWLADKSATGFGARTLLFCDVVDGQIKAVPRALFAVAVELHGADVSGPVGHAVEAYYRRMADTFNDSSIKPPWVN